MVPVDAYLEESTFRRARCVDAIKRKKENRERRYVKDNGASVSVSRKMFHFICAANRCAKRSLRVFLWSLFEKARRSFPDVPNAVTTSPLRRYSKPQRWEAKSGEQGEWGNILSCLFSRKAVTAAARGARGIIMQQKQIFRRVNQLYSDVDRYDSASNDTTTIHRHNDSEVFFVSTSPLLFLRRTVHAYRCLRASAARSPDVSFVGTPWFKVTFIREAW